MLPNKRSRDEKPCTAIRVIPTRCNQRKPVHSKDPEQSYIHTHPPAKGTRESPCTAKTQNSHIYTHTHPPAKGTRESLCTAKTQNSLPCAQQRPRTVSLTHTSPCQHPAQSHTHINTHTSYRTRERTPKLVEGMKLY